jgi:ribosome maturation factor RimP
MPARPHRVDELLPELEQVAESAGCELVHAELKGTVLRLILDKPEGVTLADCERVSKQVSALLDVLDFGSQRYVLEVSSPGLDRPLYRPRDYERFVGRLARVTVLDRETGKKRTVVARLQGFRPGEGAAATSVEAPEAKIVLADDRTGAQEVIALRDVKTARLEIEL